MWKIIYYLWLPYEYLQKKSPLYLFVYVFFFPAIRMFLMYPNHHLFTKLKLILSKNKANFDLIYHIFSNLFLSVYLQSSFVYFGLILMSMSRCLTAKDKGEKKLFGYSFVPLMQEDGRTLPDGTHELIIHKVKTAYP